MMSTAEKCEIRISETIGGGYDEFWRSRKRYVAVKGSRASKKSKTTALWIITKMMQYPLANTLVIRRTYRTIKDSCFSDLRWAAERLGVSAYWKFTLNPLEITYLPTGQKILFRGLDDGLKITSISVPMGYLCWAWLEEAYEVTSEDDFNKVDMSFRGLMPDGYFIRIMLTFNPWSANSWLKARFFDDPDENTLAMTTTYQCNEWLSDADRDIYAKMKANNPRRYRIEGEGEWGIAEGLIYERFRQEGFDVDEIRGTKGMKAAFGLDFGFTDPAAFTACMVDSMNMKIYVFDEWYQQGATNQQIAERIKQMDYGGQRIICDSAEPKSITELRMSGLRAEASRKGSDSVLYGIQLLQNYEFIVHPKCRQFWIEINNYCWEKDKFDKPVDKPEHEFSHGMDSIRYAVTDALRGDIYNWGGLNA